MISAAAVIEQSADPGEKRGLRVDVERQMYH
jgi:hypothetical protein